MPSPPAAATKRKRKRKKKKKKKKSASQPPPTTAPAAPANDTPKPSPDDSDSDSDLEQLEQATAEEVRASRFLEQGLLLARRGQVAGALKVLQMCLQLHVEMFGPAFSAAAGGAGAGAGRPPAERTTCVWMEVAVLQARQGDVDRAVRMVEDVLHGMHEAELSRQSPLWDRVFWFLAQLAQMAGDVETAKARLRECVDQRVAVYGAKSPRTAQALQALLKLYERTGGDADGVARVNELLETDLGDEPDAGRLAVMDDMSFAQLMMARQMQGQQLLKSEQLDEALRVFLGALELHRTRARATLDALDGEEQAHRSVQLDYSVLPLLRNVANMHAFMGNSAEACDILAETVAVEERLRDSEPIVLRLSTRAQLAMALHGARRWAEAETEYKAAVDGLTQHLGAEHERVQVVDKYFQQCRVRRPLTHSRAYFDFSRTPAELFTNTDS